MMKIRKYIFALMALGLITFLALESKNKIYNAVTNIGNYKYYLYGNSITAGSKWQLKLFRMDIRNTGTSGYTTTHMVWNLQTKVIKHHPKICFIMGGINDINTGIPLSRTKANYQSIIDSLMSNSINPVIQSTLYVARVGHPANKMVDSLNSFLNTIASERDIDYIDLNDLLSENGHLKPKYTFDGIHLNKAAYKVWLTELESFLSGYETLDSQVH